MIFVDIWRQTAERAPPSNTCTFSNGYNESQMFTCTSLRRKRGVPRKHQIELCFNPKKSKMSGPVRKILVGQVIGTKMLRTAKVRVNKLELDPFVTQYFPKKSTVFAHDPAEAAKLGDIVLVKELPIRKSVHVKYQMERIIYSLGNVTDPITGKKCDCYSYWDDDKSAEDVSLSELGVQETTRTIGEERKLTNEGTPV